MRKVLRRLLRWPMWTAGVSVLAVALLWTLSRARGPTAAQDAAVAEALRPVDAPGANAFAAFMLVASSHADRDDAGQALAAIRRSRALPPVRAASGLERSDRRLARGPDLALMPAPEDLDLFCQAAGEGCLGRVRGSLDRYRILVARHATLIDRVVGLGRYGHYAAPAGAPVPPGLKPPALRLGLLPMTRHALQFADGDVEAGLAGVCRDIATWRRFAFRSDSLGVSVRAVEISSRANARLFADMLLEWPGGRPLPSACAPALAPTGVAELSRCRVARGELAELAATTAIAFRNDDRPWPVRALGYFFLDGDMLVAESSYAPAAACSATVLAALRQDLPVPASAVPRIGDALTCVSNVAGCMLASLTQALYVELFRSAQDHGARLRVLATLARLHASAADDRDVGLRLHDRAVAPDGPGRRISACNGGRSLCIRQYVGRKTVWSLPVPQASAPTSRGR